MTDNTLEYQMRSAVLHMNNRLKESGYNERERAYMWGMTVTEQRVFLTGVWENQHNDKKVNVKEEVKAKPGPPKPPKEEKS